MGTTNVQGKNYDDEIRSISDQLYGSVKSVNQKTGEEIILSSSDIMHVDENNIVQPISETIGELKNSVADGKNAVANAISEKGIVATGSESFADLSSKIDQIKQGVGNATAEDVLSGKTFSNNDGTNLIGTMYNNGADLFNLTKNNQVYTIPPGYHNGHGTVTCKPTNLTAGNIRKGVTVGGVSGSYEPRPTHIDSSVFCNHNDPIVPSGIGKSITKAINPSYDLKSFFVYFECLHGAVTPGYSNSEDLLVVSGFGVGYKNKIFEYGYTGSYIVEAQEPGGSTYMYKPLFEISYDGGRNLTFTNRYGNYYFMASIAISMLRYS